MGFACVFADGCMLDKGMLDARRESAGLVELERGR